MVITIFTIKYVWFIFFARKFSADLNCGNTLVDDVGLQLPRNLKTVKFIWSKCKTQFFQKQMLTNWRY